ncbi:hypothetical protein [Nocardioides daeguensis]|uniref:DUF4878 domain-containing protein n=1 Tax=Nocardioides daeguensis TaxID=908359 RepID=A0ABP6V975_9ACTN|nr:hypothetical protein [Nocardioides daeguensis]MBV6726340.1 hypothetical protein [Nocardioides daeguensis]MCR1772183.1 hypothetical protein [Nocardioides daeguensis]
MARSRRASLVGIAAVAALLAGGVAAFAVVSGDDDEAGARSAAQRYLRILSDDGRDPDDLTELVAVGDPEALDRADTLLAQARERISDVSLGESREISTAETSSDVVFDRFERVEVRYRLAGERHRSAITLGLPRTGTDGGWLVVTPLSGEVDWNAASWGTAQLDVEVGDVAVTEPGRTTYEPDAQLVHPGVYPVRASVGPYLTSPATDLVVATGSTPLPTFDLAPTADGTAAITEQVLAAFEPCTRGTAYCPATTLVDDDPLPEGWWHGFTTEPTVTVEGTTITLRDGAFRYASAAGERTVRFDGTGRMVVDPATGEPGVAVPLELERR